MNPAPSQTPTNKPIDLGIKAATAVRLTIAVARQLKAIGARWGVELVGVDGGQCIALLTRNPALAENP